MKDPRLDDYKRLKDFETLIVDTIAALERPTAAASFGAALEPLIARWESSDRDFAALLREVKGQAWQMEAAHLRAVAEKFRGHLDVNLQNVRRQLKQLA